MTLARTLIGTNDDGTPRYHYQSDNPNAVLMLTGPAAGGVTLADGTAYDVSPDVIEVASEAHAAEINHHIGLQHEATGRFNTTDPATGEPRLWKHTDCPHCPAPA